MSNNSREEPKTAPQPDRWYDLVLGPSFKDDSSNKFCTLRYEFKPASIDKSRSGTLHKNKDNRVSVEFQNNQLGKPKVTFEGCSEDYKENDAVLFFDGETFRLERLHRAVKQLRHLRMAGESATAASQAALAAEPRLSPVGRGAKFVHLDRSSVPAVPVAVERIEIGKLENPGSKDNGKGIAAEPANTQKVSAISPGHNTNEEGDEHHEIDLVEIFGAFTPENEKTGEEKAEGGFDINVVEQHDIEEEIADVDDSGDEGEKGLNAAEALRAQVNAEERKEQSSSSSSSSGSRSSGSESGGRSGSRSRSKSSGSESGGQSSSGSSSGESEASDDDSINSV